MNGRRIAGMVCCLIVGASSVVADPMLENGDFESGALAPEWVEMDPHYPTSPTELFDGVLEPAYPMLETYDGTWSCGWTRNDGTHNWPGYSSTDDPTNRIRQTFEVEPGTYPVTVSGAVLIHHDRIGQPEEFWGAGIRMRIYSGTTDEHNCKWQHEFWPHEGESFWRYYEEINNQLPGHEGDNTVQTRGGTLIFEIAYFTKWAIDWDICAVDNVQVDFVGATRLDPTGGVINPPGGGGQVTPDLETVEPPRTALQSTMDGPFPSPIDADAGYFPTWLEAGDFDGDDHVDVAVANEWNHTVSLLMGDGTGRLPRRFDLVTAPHGYNPRSLAAADFNGDDQLDLAVANKSVAPGNDPTVAIYLGNGDGTLADPPAAIVTTGLNPTGLAIGQFNRDQDTWPDLLVCEEGNLSGGGSTFALFLGNGDGTFTLVQREETADNPRYIAVADFNDDDYDDVFVVCWSMFDNLHCYVGDGTGHLTHSTTKNRSDWQDCGATVADFDENGTQDVIVCGTWPSMAKYWHNYGDATFWHGEKIGIGRQPTQICSFDLNTDEDHYIDYATSNLETCDVMVHLSLDWGFFDLDRVVGFTSGDSPRFIVSADFNEDSIPDMAVANADNNRVSILLGRADGQLEAGSTHKISSWPGQPQGVAFGDFDGDEDLDAVVSSSSGIDSDRIDVYRNDGSIYLNNRRHFDCTLSPTDIDCGDFDEDGNLDIVVARTAHSTVRVYMGDGTMDFPTFTAPRCGGGPEDVVVADFDNDNHLDIATANRGGNSVTVLPGLGDGYFGTRAATSVYTGPASMAAGLFDADDILDVATANSGSGDVSILIGVGNGAFTVQTPIPVGTEPYGIATGDFTSDGILDLAVTRRGDDAVTVLIGDGLGGFGDPREVAVGRAPKYMVSDDFNGDGRDDLALGCEDEGTVWILYTAGDGTFPTRQVMWASRYPQRLCAGDFWNDDGLPDLAVATSDNTRWQLFENRSMPYVPSPFRITAVERETESTVRIRWQEETGPVDVYHSPGPDPADWQPAGGAGPGALTTVVPVDPAAGIGSWRLATGSE